ncbi:hypothetical protein O0235_10530 [Tepidiforma flava]|uniref:Transcription regulator PadR C-terminal domain-containing protein n=1 Tax=Tepidiforma flava TaxID=3004094 RepID=A0ABY7M6G7_9CHLR|nr:hypothetical protein [Tepidiforma flava]WBL35223.1 hypothetical protein O0235_10530 [Tepidiforma flava]
MGGCEAAARTRSIYDLWDDRTVEILAAIYGEELVQELQRYYEAAGKRGRLPGVRGQAENMTLNIHGPWGIHARLERAERVLKELVQELERADGAAQAR